MSKLALLLCAVFFTTTVVWCDVSFTIRANGKEYHCKKYEDIKNIIMGELGEIFGDEETMKGFSTRNKKAEQNPKFKAYADKVLKSEPLTEAEDEEFVKLHYQYFGEYIKEVYKAKGWELDYKES